MSSLEPAQVLLLAAAALVAGAVNAVAGGGLLLLFSAPAGGRLPALTANVTNSVALTPGYFGGTLGYRRELAGQRRRILALGATSTVGAVVGIMVLAILGIFVADTLQRLNARKGLLSLLVAVVAAVAFAVFAGVSWVAVSVMRPPA